MGGELNGDKRDFDTLRLDRGGLSGAGNIQKPRAEADDVLPLAGRAAEIVPARDAVFSAGSSDGNTVSSVGDTGFSVGGTVVSVGEDTVSSVLEGSA